MGSLSGNPPKLTSARKLRIPLICELVRQLRYAYMSLTSGLVRGMRIVGDIPRPDPLLLKEAHSDMGLRDVRGAERAKNQ